MRAAVVFVLIIPALAGCVQGPDPIDDGLSGQSVPPPPRLPGQGIDRDKLSPDVYGILIWGHDGRVWPVDELATRNTVFYGAEGSFIELPVLDVPLTYERPADV